jgi:hypothetical protein
MPSHHDPPIMISSLFMLRQISISFSAFPHYHTDFGMEKHIVISKLLWKN